MKDKPVDDKKLKFQYRLIAVNKLGYFENDIQKYQFKNEISKRNIPFQLTVNIAINDSEGTIDIILKVKFFYHDNKRDYDLFGIDTSHKFAIKDFNVIFTATKKNKYVIPDEVIASFLSVAISGTRGMLAMINTNKQYEHILLPLLHPLDVIKQGKEKPKST